MVAGNTHSIPAPTEISASNKDGVRFTVQQWQYLEKVFGERDFDDTVPEAQLRVQVGIRRVVNFVKSRVQS